MNPWKWTALAFAIVLVGSLATGVVVANWPSRQAEQASTEPPPPAPGATTPAAPGPVVGQAPTPMGSASVTSVAPTLPSGVHAPAPRPSRAAIAACNRYAELQSRDTTAETIKDGLLGGAVGAGVGAAGGAIAGGGEGAGKGAGIGALVGAAAGTLFGLNEAHQHDARVAAAYRTCMQRRGYGG